MYSDLRQASRQELASIAPLPAPFTIYIEPTNRCNFKCVFCPESLKEYEDIAGGYNSLSLENWHIIAQNIEDIGKVKTINFYMMGEPFLNKNLLSFICDAKERALSDRLIVTSNGSLINKSIQDELISSKLDYLRISIYGANEEMQRKNSQVPISLSRIKKNLSDLAEKKIKMNSRLPHTYIKMIDSLDNGLNTQFLEDFSDLGDEIAIEPRMDWDSQSDKDFSQMGKDNLLESDYFSKKKEVCPFPFYTLVIHSDLRVSVCCVDWSKSLIIGDLRNESLTDIWHGENLLELQLKHLRREKHRISACKNCNYLLTAPDNLDNLDINDYLARR